MSTLLPAQRELFGSEKIFDMTLNSLGSVAGGLIDDLRGANDDLSDRLQGLLGGTELDRGLAALERSDLYIQRAESKIREGLEDLQRALYSRPENR